jgi:hypothetical protein
VNRPDFDGDCSTRAGTSGLSVAMRKQVLSRGH